MPMRGQHILDENGRVIGIACTRERVRRCYTCHAGGAELTCDGCDHVLCGGCAVSPKPELDFCPSCFAGAWRHWVQFNQVPSMQSERRAAFRTWAGAEPELFLGLTKARTKKSLREAP